MNISNVKYFLKEAQKEALKSTCLRARCGSIIVKNKKIIGRGFNSPPANLESQRRCKNKKSNYNLKVTDKTCCIHAEQRAIFDALIKNKNLIKDSTIYFIRIDSKGNLTSAGKPYCTICSKSALDVGIKKWILYFKGKIRIYDSEKYNDLSFNFS